MKVLRLGDVWSKRPKLERTRRLRGRLPTRNGIAERAGIMRMKHTQRVMGLSKANEAIDQTAFLAFVIGSTSDSASQSHSHSYKTSRR